LGAKAALREREAAALGVTSKRIAMSGKILAVLGQDFNGASHRQDPGVGSHAHGAVDPSIAASERRIWAVKWSFAGLSATALVQVVGVLVSGSAALLSDTIHNVGDATTAIPLWVTFALFRLRPSRRFTLGYGRVEDLAGVIVVLMILSSATVAGSQAVERFFNSQPVEFLWAVAAASVVGFVGNEAVAVFRIRVGRHWQTYKQRRSGRRRLPR